MDTQNTLPTSTPEIPAPQPLTPQSLAPQPFVLAPAPVAALPETPPQSVTPEAFDDELLYAEDESGAKIPDSQIIAKATEVHTLTFKAAGVTHKVQVRFDQIDYLTRRARAVLINRIMEEHGVFGIEDEQLKEDPELQEKAEAANEAIETSPEFLEARAAICCAAVVRDNKGRPRVSVPAWRESFSPKIVAQDHIFGRPFILAVEKEVFAFFG